MSNEQETVAHVLHRKNFPFAPLTKVLIRNSDGEPWYIDAFYICRPELQRPFICEGGAYEQAIAYKGNEHLIRKTFPEGYISVGDRIVCRDYEGRSVWSAGRSVLKEGHSVWRAGVMLPANSFPSSMEYPFLGMEYYPMPTHAHLIGTNLPADTPAPNKPTFKAFDRVLVRDREGLAWTAAHFSHYDGEDYEYHTTSGTGYRFCVPYEGNEDSVGTDD